MREISLEDIKKSILEIADKTMLNEAQTKHKLILPMFVYLGYDILNTDEFIPEYTADVGIKQGEKVDYAICINGQPLILIEAKKLSVTLGKDQVSQLFRYFASTDARIAILTNGDDYWFFTDSQKVNQMDYEPYFKFKMSSITDFDINALNGYSRQFIDILDIAYDVQTQRYKTVVTNLINQMQTGNLDREFIEWMANKSEVISIEKTKMASIFNELFAVKFGIKKEDTQIAKGNKEKAVRSDKSNKEKVTKSEVVVGKEYKLNEVDWSFHKPDYILISKSKYEVKSFSEIVIRIVDTICTKQNGIAEKLIEQFSTGTYRMTKEKQEGMRAGFKVGEHELYVYTALRSSDICKFIYKILEAAGIDDSELKISFVS